VFRARPDSLEISSLAAEPAPGLGFVASLFDVADFDVQAFVQREEEFDFAMVDFTEMGYVPVSPLALGVCRCPPPSGGQTEMLIAVVAATPTSH
jgi:hypothetical protein